MYARLVTYHGRPDKLQDGLREWENRSPSVDSMEGLQNVYVLTDKKTGDFTIVSFWDTEEHLNASMNAINTIRDALTHTLGSSLPTPQVYEVSAERSGRMRRAA